MTHGGFDLVTDGGLTIGARVLVALSRVDRELPLCLLDVFAKAGVTKDRGRVGLQQLQADGYVESEPGFGRYRERKYQLSPLGWKMARKLARSPGQDSVPIQTVPSRSHRAR